MKRFEDIRLVAAVFMILGLIAIGDFLVNLLGGEIRFELDLLMLPAGIGLLFYKEVWRVTALIIVTLYALAIIAIPLLAYTAAPKFTVTVAGHPIQPNSPQAVALVVVYLIVIGGLVMWAFRVLTKKEIVAEFAAAREESWRR